jgi:hypothetical protein
LKYSWDCSEFLKIDCSSYTKNTLTIDYATYKDKINSPSSGKISAKVSKDIRETQKLLNLTISSELTTGEPAKTITINMMNSISSNNIILISLINDNSSMANIQFLWTVNDSGNNDLYINGRANQIVKINTDLLNIGNNTITLNVIDEKGKEYSAEYIYNKDSGPIGGKCIALPNEGISLDNVVKFYIENWQTTNAPLSYELIAKSSNEDLYLIDKTFNNIIITSKLPVDYKIYAKITDNKNQFVLDECPVLISINKNLTTVDEVLDKATSPDDKLLLISILKSNNITLGDKIMTESANILESMVESPNIKNNLDKIISQTQSLAQANILDNNLNSIIHKIIDNLSTVVPSNTQVQNIFNLIDSNKEKVDSDNLIKKVTDNAYNSLLPGETLTLKSKNSQIKIANVADSGFSFNSDDSKECNKNSVVCLSPDKNVGIVAQYSSINNLEDSLSLDTFKYKTIPENASLGQIEVKLNAANLNNLTENQLADTVCVVIDDNNIKTPCITYYDYEINKILCQCDKPGIISAVFNSTLAKMSMITQFNIKELDIVNSYSITSIAYFAIFLIILLIIAFYKDSKDKIINFKLKYKDLDLTQYHLIILERKYKKLNISLWNIFVQNFKVIFSLCSFYIPLHQYLQFMIIIIIERSGFWIFM